MQNNFKQRKRSVFVLTNLDELRQYNRIHMIGIGGVSMSGIAEILKNWGFTVTGSDRTDSPTIHKLIETGIPVKIGHDLENVKLADAVVYTAAIQKDDPELLLAKELNIPVIERSTFLGKITKAFKDTICISGTHGKTTTTSMISLCFVEAFKDPSIQVGAYLKPIDGNYRVGNSDYFIIEACEYVESFLKFYPRTEVILNIDNDHLDYFKNIENIKKSFSKYIKLLPTDGLLVINHDDENCNEVLPNAKCQVVTYGIHHQDSDYYATNIQFDENGFPSFDVYYHNRFLENISLSIVGSHNVLNALACVAVCMSYGISPKQIKETLHQYTGADRRFEYKGSFNQVNVYDDYGHHPTEVFATSEALKKKQYHESWVVFQPHTYSRTKNHLMDFARALCNFDHVIITDIYAARETNNYNVTAKTLVEAVQSLGKEATYISDFQDIVDYLKKNTQANDIVLTLGAGTVTEIGPMLVH